MTTDITELAQREKFEAWLEGAEALPWGYLKKRRTSEGAYQESNVTDMWAAWKAAGAELVEALEKAQLHIARQEQILLNQDESLSIRRGELEAAQQERENWRASFDNERFRADKLAATLSDEIELAANVRGQLLIAHKTLLNQQAKLSKLESRTVTVKLPKRSVGEVMHMSGFSRDYAEGWCAGNDNAIHEISNTAGIKVEAG